MKIKISRKVLLAMNTFTSRNESRYVINGVCLEVQKQNCFVIATDGRRIAAIKSGEVLEQPEKKTSVVIRIEPAMLKAMPKDSKFGDDVVLTLQDKSVQFSSPGKSAVKFESELIEGSFPAWRQVIPKGKIALPINPSFNWRLLEGFVKASDIIRGSGSDHAIIVRQQDELSPMLILIPSIPDFVGALMPMRVNGNEAAPSWTEEEVAVPATPEPAKTPAIAAPTAV